MMSIILTSHAMLTWGEQRHYFDVFCRGRNPSHWYLLKFLLIWYNGLSVRFFNCTLALGFHVMWVSSCNKFPVDNEWWILEIITHWFTNHSCHCWGNIGMWLVWLITKYYHGGYAEQTFVSMFGMPDGVLGTWLKRGKQENLQYTKLVFFPLWQPTLYSSSPLYGYSPHDHLQA